MVVVVVAAVVRRPIVGLSDHTHTLSLPLPFNTVCMEKRRRRRRERERTVRHLLTFLLLPSFLSIGVFSKADAVAYKNKNVRTKREAQK